ncbi:hypothetical protein [Streptomyces sp. NPDC046727]|uniref:hypothetical protein n=1 Tax=Streptomyces sp. NPDC046727 TaxID=3155373 RepID=UPI0033D2878E
MFPDVPAYDPRLRSREARHPYERKRLVMAVSWLTLLFVVFLGTLAATDLAALLWTILLIVVVVVSIWIFMRFWNARLLGRAVKVTSESFPELHAEIVRLRSMLDYHRPIDVYVADDVDGKMTITSLLGTRVLLIEGGFAADLQAEGPAPFRFLLGSFISYLKARHGQLAIYVIILERLKWAAVIDPWLLPYERSAEYTRDQIGYLCAGDLNASLGVISRLTVGKEFAGKVEPAGVLEQACRVARSPLSRLAEVCQAMPHMVNRYVNLITYAAAMRPADFERYRAGLTDKGRERLGELLTQSPHHRNRPATWTPRQATGGSRPRGAT